MTRRALVTGAGGFVGGFLTRGLLEAGYAVTGLDQFFDEFARASLAGAELVESDITAEVLDGLGAFDLVIHGAAITSPSPETGLTAFDCLRINCETTLVVLAKARACGATDFVLLSSSGVFRSEDADGVLLESTPARATIPYAVAKRAGELLLEAELPGEMRAIAIRLGPIYGPGERVRQTRQHMSPLRRWIEAGRNGDAIVVDLPRSRRDWTYGPDLPKALLALLDRQPAISGVIHFTSGEDIDDVELAEMIAAKYGVEVRLGDGVDYRVPMTSEIVPPADLFGWTPLATGLNSVMEDRP